MRLFRQPIHGTALPLAIGLLMVLALGLARAPIARAQTFTVTKPQDTADGSCAPSDCSLREAIIAANSTAGADRIDLPAGTYKLTRPGRNENSASTGDLDIIGDLVITGALSSTTIIDSEQRDRIFEIFNAHVTIASVTIQHGHSDIADGGGISNTGTLTVTNSAISNNSSNEAGGGIANYGTLTLSDSTIAANSAITGGSGVGGGVMNKGRLTATGTIFRDNTAQADGGGIYNADSPQSIVSLNGVTITQNAAVSNNSFSGNGGGIANYGVLRLSASTISGNSAESGGGLVTQRSLHAIDSVISGNSATFGGGITISDTLTMTNTTISGNSALENGGGITTIGTVNLNNVTIAGNTADSNGDGFGKGGGIRISTGTVNLKNTILAGNLDKSGQAPECSGTLVSQDYNLILQPAGCTIAGGTAHTIIGQDPKLGPLQQNGGPTATRALLAGSPAIDAGDPAAPGGANACAATDQRGIARPQQSRCDIGALEKIRPPAVALAFNPATIVNDGTSTLTIAITNASATSPITGVTLTATLPAGLSIAAAPPATSTCGGALLASAGSSTIGLTGAALAAGGTCTIGVTITSSAPGVYTTSAGPASATETGAGTASNTATLTVQVRILVFLPLIAKS